MECLSPMSIARPNGGGATDRITVPCGKCIACLSKLRIQWSFRLKQELKVSKSAYFITLTYSEEHLPKDGNVSVRHCQLFLKRLRKACEKISQIDPLWPKIKYYLVSEYGEKTFRPHYHFICFNIPDSRCLLDSCAIDKLILKTWKLGHIKVGTVTPASIAYVTKYCINHKEDTNGHLGTFSLISSRPAIGYCYLEKFTEFHRETDKMYATDVGGIKLCLPRYYKEKIFCKNHIEKKNKELQEINDEKFMHDLEESDRSGEDFFLNDLNKKIQVKERLLKNLNEKSKL